MTQKSTAITVVIKGEWSKIVSLVNYMDFSHTLEGFNEYINSIASTWMFPS